VKKRIRRLIAGLTLTAAAATGLALTTDLPTLHPASDTTWGAPDSPNDTRWDTAPTETEVEPPADNGPAITPLDTTWG
jgi:hypothetical protein